MTSTQNSPTYRVRLFDANGNTKAEFITIYETRQDAERAISSGRYDAYIRQSGSLGAVPVNQSWAAN